MNLNNSVTLEELMTDIKYFNKQEGRKYPCSNQVVVCGVITRDREKAISIMNKKGAVMKRHTHNHIEWELFNERWIWHTWNDYCRGYRFYKMLVDKNIDKELLYYARIKADLYCCYMELI